MGSGRRRDVAVAPERAFRSLSIRPPVSFELTAARALHEKGFPEEFLTRLGGRFLARYYRAFAESPHAVALVAVEDPTARVVGVLLGTLDTGAHYGYLTRRHGPWLAIHALARAARDRRLAGELLRTRLARYARGVVRSILPGGSSDDPGPREKVGVLTQVTVDPDWRGLGVGAALLKAYEVRAQQAELDWLQLATRPGEDGAGPFYERLGWRHEGERTSRSGERFSIYSKTVPDCSSEEG